MCDRFARALSELWLDHINENVTCNEFIENHATESKYNIIPTEDIHEGSVGMKICDICKVTKESMLSEINNETYNIVIQSLLSNDDILSLFYGSSATFLFLAQRYIAIPHGYEELKYVNAANTMANKPEFTDIVGFKIFLVIYFVKCIRTYYEELLCINKNKQRYSMKNVMDIGFVELAKKLCNIFLLDYSLLALFFNEKYTGASSKYYNKLCKEFMGTDIKLNIDLWNSFTEKIKNSFDISELKLKHSSHLTTEEIIPNKFDSSIITDSDTIDIIRGEYQEQYKRLKINESNLTKDVQELHSALNKARKVNLEEKDKSKNRALQNIKGNNAENLCAVCISNKFDMMFLPCKHISCCEECSIKVNTCPICRKNISEKIKCYIS